MKNGFPNSVPWPNWLDCDCNSSSFVSGSLEIITPPKGDLSLIPGLGRSLRRREWLPTPVFLPGEFLGQRSLVGYSPRGHKESDTTEQLTLSLYKILTTKKNKKSVNQLPIKVCTETFASEWHHMFCTSISSLPVGTIDSPGHRNVICVLYTSIMPPLFNYW